MRAKKLKRNDVIFNIINYSVFAMFTFICVYPFYYLVINTISNNTMSANGMIRFIPHGVHLDNYINVIQLDGLARAALISFGRTVIGTLCTVFASAFLGFIFIQKKLWLRKVWYRMIVITMYFNAGLIPMFITMKNLNLVNSFWVYVLPAVVQPFNIILVKTFMESLPGSLQEAAEIDGASIFNIFTRIILPISKPILATIAIFSAVGQWNSFQDTLIYVTKQSLYSLQYLLYLYINQANSLATMMRNNASATSLNMSSVINQQTPTSIRMTVSVIVILPILCVYPIFQRYFVKGIMIGSVKG